MSELGSTIRRQVKESLFKDPRLDAQTRRLLRRTLPELARVIELWCPMALVATTSGPRAAYGPTPSQPDWKHFIAVTARDGIVTAIKDWPEVPAATAPRLRGRLWAEAATAIRGENGGMVAVTLTSLLGDAGRAHVDRQARDIVAKQLFPALVALVGKPAGGTVAAGAMCMVALPQPLVLQVAAIEAQAATTGAAP